MIDWQAVIKKHGPAVWQTVYRLLNNHADAADCFQETFVCALQVSQRQRVRSFPALLVRLATSRAIDRLRQRLRQSRSKADLADWANVPSDNPGPLQEAQQQELVARLRKLLSQLPAQEAQVLCLRYLNEMRYRQIAQELGIKTKMVGVLLHRARAKLRDSLELPLKKKAGV